jgi:putative ABC transport system permease protein
LLLALFAGLALVLSAIGVYGVVAFGVSRRRREVGIRLALGAEPRGVRALVVSEGMRPVLLGTAIGVALSLLGSTMIEQILFGVGRFDPVSYAATAGALVLTGLAASWIPARRAAAGSALVALSDDGS